VTEEKKQADIQVLVDNLDKRGLLVLMVLLGQRAIDILEKEDEAKKTPAILKPNRLIV
jgi:hypothetical protein